MTDIVLLILCILLGFWLGKSWERQLWLREEVISLHCEFARNLLSNVKCGKVTMTQFVSDFTAECKSDAFIKCVDKFFYGKETSIGVKLTTQQLKSISDFWSGRFTSTQQFISHIEYYIDYFGNLSRQLKEECRQRSSLGVKLGILLGSALGLMLI
ncbi:MAG TPA: hypothetical protein IAD47_04295 [Candidatus Limihabitans stercoravium]|nr:hypothetical protein [Candidatus Limihabitans stercoravium]